MTPLQLMAKAEQAASSAKLLLESGDTDGTCNRAYYAMFDAARAALVSLGFEDAKTHKGVLSAFNQNLVKSGRLPHKMGKSIKWAESMRSTADYRGDTVKAVDASELADEAKEFIATIRSEFFTEKLKEKRPTIQAQSIGLIKESKQANPSATPSMPDTPDTANNTGPKPNDR